MVPAVEGMGYGHKLSPRIRLSVWTLLLLCALFSFETIAYDCIRFVSDRFGISLDAGFWAMGISAAAWFSLSLLLIHQLLDCRSVSLTDKMRSLLPTLLFIVFFLVQLYRRPFALPFWDDYYGYYEWQLKKGAASGLSSAFDAYVATYLECKTTVSRLVAEGFRFLTGTGFVHVTKYLNLLILAVIAWLIASEHPDRFRRRIVYWISGILLFNLQQFYNVLCAFSGTTYYLVVLFALLAFRFRQGDNSRDTVLTLMFASAAAFTFGNGWIVFPLILLGYFLDRRYRSLIIGLVVFTGMAVFYFSDYHPERLNPLDRFAPSQFLLYAISFLGGHMQFHDAYLLPLIAGGGMMAVLFIALLRKGRKSTQFTSLYLLVFLTCTAFLAALFRHQNGFQQSLSLRYGFFSVTALAAAFSYSLVSIPDSVFVRYSRIFLGIAVAITGLKSLLFYPEMAIAQTENHRMIRNWLLAGIPIEKRTAFYPEGTTGLLEKSEKAGLWKRSAFDTTSVNNTLFTIRYITPNSPQRDPVH